MFVPTIGLALIGDFFDSMLSSRPWLMLVGTALGAAVEYWLIWHQLKKV
ncbi:MAG: AtpZ/AtpI family protein, partial [Candidatus Saccharimonadales bacterium]